MFMRLLAGLRRLEMALAVALLGLIAGVVFAGTVFRYLGQPLIWSEELAQALFVWLALLASDLTLQRAGHFRIDLLVQRLPPALRTVLDIVIKLMMAGLLAALAWSGLELIRVSHPRPLPMLDVPSSLAAAALPIAFVLMFITVVEQIVRRLRGEPDHDGDAREVM